MPTNGLTDVVAEPSRPGYVEREGAQADDAAAGTATPPTKVSGASAILGRLYPEGVLTVPLVLPTRHETGQDHVLLRSYAAGDHAAVLELLSVLPTLYPNGGEWLQRRLAELRPGGPRCTLAIVDDVVAGITIETPKSTTRMKLSTIYIAEPFRGRGAGRKLARLLVDRWLGEQIQDAYVTAAHTVAEQVNNCLGRYGFSPTVELRDRYGSGRHEVIFRWCPLAAMAANC